MLPLTLQKTSQGRPMLVELKNGDTYNGHLVNCDTWMNNHLREDGDRFWRIQSSIYEFQMRKEQLKKILSIIEHLPRFIFKTIGQSEEDNGEIVESPVE